MLFADLKGSMELLADRDPEEARKLLDPVLELMMEAVHHYEGTVNQAAGDGIMALFGAPLAHEDHAVRACYAALRMQERAKRHAEAVFHTHGVNLQIRVGLNSGDVVVGTVGSDLRMDYTAIGRTTHLAARMEQLASPGSILVTPSTLELVDGFVTVKSLGPVPVKGLIEPLEVHEVTGVGPVRTRFQSVARRGLTPFVGRERELEQLRQAQRLAGSGQGQVVALVAEAGVGKSRLVYELAHSPVLDGWLVMECAAVSYGKAMSYLPVVNLLKSYFEITEQDSLQTISDKVKTKLLALDGALAPTLPALLALLDAPVNDPAWQTLDPARAPSAHAGRGAVPPAAGSTTAATAIDFRRPALDRQRDTGGARQPGRELGVGTYPAAGNLSARIPAWLGGQDLLQPASTGRACGRERRPVAGCAAR